jgi:heat shock protein HtpX
VELTKNPDAMISALRKIEGRGELVRANSAVMEMCVDNPREGFADIFATHPSVEKRVAALVQFAGGHDPGPLDIAPPDQNPGEPVGESPAEHPNPTSVPQEGNREPGSFLPGKPPIELGPPSPSNPLPIPGPWGPPNRN